MKRINVHLDEALDTELARAAERSGESKAALIRRAARAYLDDQAVAVEDPWASFTGAVTAEPTTAVHDDVVIYR